VKEDVWCVSQEGGKEGGNFFFVFFFRQAIIPKASQQLFLVPFVVHA